MKLKKIILYIAGPGVLAVEVIALFVHIFTTINARPWIIAGLVIFFLVFLPLYSIEYFKQNFKNDRETKSLNIKRRNTRTEWQGGNIHGKTPVETERPGKLFNKK